ncbi:hypothetical protein POM88_040827 [Heracleum sosnowskyi]|uniref:F-box domain-containing protein n=1 Tax=Heracleum sosnowskyi TaxID=360622 RepID=A0AAD8M958_9APIA|nr:hypothetical protein POM88_040827 [Heracleum sosnowskyi]
MSLTPFLTDDLMAEILQRLPVKPLLRCKAVGKPWLSLITSPGFIKSQLAFAISTALAANQILIAHCRDTSIALVNLGSRETVAHLEFPFSDDSASETPVDQGDSSNPSVSLINSASRRLLIKFDLGISENQSSRMTDCLLVASACGIVCLRSKRNNIYLWNPAIKQSKIIPPPKLADCGVFRASYGFGFDEVGNDFKVVRVVLPYLFSEVYSANTNAWRLVDVKPNDIPGVNVIPEI